MVLTLNRLFVVLFLAIFMIFKLANGGCPAGFTRLDACIGGECPNQQEAGRTYQCIGDDCCSPNQQAAGGCVDGATNCALFIQYCRTPMYIQCMMQNCGQTCGFCSATG